MAQDLRCPNCGSDNITLSFAMSGTGNFAGDIGIDCQNCGKSFRQGQDPSKIDVPQKVSSTNASLTMYSAETQIEDYEGIFLTYSSGTQYQVTFPPECPVCGKSDVTFTDVKIQKFESTGSYNITKTAELSIPCCLEHQSEGERNDIIRKVLQGIGITIATVLVFYLIGQATPDLANQLFYTAICGLAPAIGIGTIAAQGLRGIIAGIIPNLKSLRLAFTGKALGIGAQILDEGILFTGMRPEYARVFLEANPHARLYRKEKK